MKKRMVRLLCMALVVLMSVAALPAYAAAGDISSHPTDAVIALGESTSFSVAIVALAQGETAAYQWYRGENAGNEGGSAIPGATNAKLTITPTASGESYYYCVVTANDASGAQIAQNRSNAAKLTVTGDAGTGTETQNPQETPTAASTATPPPTTPPVTPTPATGYTMLRRGDSGDAVAALQKRLILLGFLEDVADGKYGGKTQQAVKDYEDAVGFDSDGAAGKETQTALFDPARVITRRYALIRQEIAAGRMSRENLTAYAQELQAAVIEKLSGDEAKAEFKRVCDLCTQAADEQYKQIDAIFKGETAESMKLSIASEWCLYMCSYWAYVSE